MLWTVSRSRSARHGVAVELRELAAQDEQVEALGVFVVVADR